MSDPGAHVAFNLVWYMARSAWLALFSIIVIYCASSSRSSCYISFVLTILVLSSHNVIFPAHHNYLSNTRLVSTLVALHIVYCHKTRSVLHHSHPTLASIFTLVAFHLVGLFLSSYRFVFSSITAIDLVLTSVIALAIPHNDQERIQGTIYFRNEDVCSVHRYSSGEIESRRGDSIICHGFPLHSLEKTIKTLFRSTR
jgi:hypothetical protein